jgi:hypothetical protein
MAKPHTSKAKNRTTRTVRYEKGQKIKGFLFLNKTPTRSERNKETVLNISMTCTL